MATLYANVRNDSDPDFGSYDDVESSSQSNITGLPTSVSDVSGFSSSTSDTSDSTSTSHLTTISTEFSINVATEGEMEDDDDNYCSREQDEEKEEADWIEFCKIGLQELEEAEEAAAAAAVAVTITTKPPAAKCSDIDCIALRRPQRAAAIRCKEQCKLLFADADDEYFENLLSDIERAEADDDCNSVDEAHEGNFFDKVFSSDYSPELVEQGLSIDLILDDLFPDLKNRKEEEGGRVCGLAGSEQKEKVEKVTYLIINWGKIGGSAHPSYRQFHSGDPLLRGITVEAVPNVQDLYIVGNVAEGEYVAGSLSCAIPGLVTIVFATTPLVVRDGTPA